jgi:hypothetical protein
VATLLVGALVLVAALAPAGSAETSGQAAAHVRQLLAQLHRLDGKVAQATRAYQAALAGLDRSVTAEILADEAAQAAGDAAAGQEGSYQATVSTIYESGGPLALYAAVLTSSSPNELWRDDQMLASVTSVERDAAQSGAVAAARAAAAVAAARDAVRHQVAAEQSVAAIANRLAALQAHQQQLVTQAQTEVRRLKAQEEARAVAAQLAALAAQRATILQSTATGAANLQILPPPPQFLRLYKAGATTCSGLSWTVLAAIGQVESGHGRDLGPSSAGALGPMQFLPSTFAEYGVDVDEVDAPDIMDPADAIYTAAAYLCVNGAGQGARGLADAVFAYNHADWYVQMVLTLAHKYQQAYG